MKKRIVHTDHAPAPIGPYSQAVAAGGFLFCSGQIPIDPKSGEVKLGPVREQAELVMHNIQALLKAEGLTLDNVVKTTIYLVSMNDFAAVNEVYGKYVTSNAPARTTIAVAQLPKNVSVEIEVLAQLAQK